MTTLRLPRYTPRDAIDARTLARAIANHIGVPASWEVDLRTSELVVDLFDADPEDATNVARIYLDAHPIDWSVTA